MYEMDTFKENTIDASGVYFTRGGTLKISREVLYMFVPVKLAYSQKQTNFNSFLRR
jgi:hypothetical protein